MARRRARRRAYSGPRVARGQYRYTPARQRALRKAQMVSARKRKGKGLSRNAKVGIAAGVGTAAVLGAAVARHKLSGSELSVKASRNTPGGIHHRTISQQHGKEHPRYTFSYKGEHYSASGRSLPSFNRHRIRVGVASLGGMTLMYRHKEISAKSAKEKLFGKKVASGGPPPQAVPKYRMTQAQKDAIPHANTQNPNVSWPQVGAEAATIQNEGLRNGTHYLSPSGVKRYPDSEKGIRAIDERVFRRSMGLGFTTAAEGFKSPWVPKSETYIDKQGRVRRVGGKRGKGRRRRKKKS